MILLQFSDDWNRELLTENDFLFLPTLQVPSHLSAYDLDHHLTESIGDWDVEGLSQVEVEHAGVVLLRIN